MAQHVKTYSRLSRALGWVLALLMLATSIITVRLPRTPKDTPLREDLRDLHMWVGMALLAFVIARLVMWVREGQTPAPPGVPHAVHAQGRLFALTIYILILCGGLLGIGQAWGAGYQPPLLPLLFADNLHVWKFSGYFHSAASFSLLLMNIAVLVFATYAVFRYRTGWLDAAPEPLVVQCLLSFATTIYALVNTGSSRLPGVEIFAAFVVVVWTLSLWRRRAFAERRQGGAAG